MKRDQTTELMLASALGTLSGMRSMSGPLLGALLRTLNEDESGPLGDRLNGRKPVSILIALALGEIVADKLPVMGDRTDPAPLFGRMVAGALAGALVCETKDTDRVAMAVTAGAVSAVAGAFAALHLRRSLSEDVGVPDPVLALIEDGLVYGSGLVLLQQLVD